MCHAILWGLASTGNADLDPAEVLICYGDNVVGYAKPTLGRCVDLAAAGNETGDVPAWENPGKFERPIRVDRGVDLRHHLSQQDNSSGAFSSCIQTNYSAAELAPRARHRCDERYSNLCGVGSRD